MSRSYHHHTLALVWDFAPSGFISVMDKSTNKKVLLVATYYYAIFLLLTVGQRFSDFSNTGILNMIVLI